MTISPTARIVRELKGAPLSCLLVLHFATQPLTEDALATWTGYNDAKTIRRAMRYLAEIQLAYHTPRAGWRLTRSAQQLPLAPALDHATGGIPRLPPGSSSSFSINTPEEQQPPLQQSHTGGNPRSTATSGIIPPATPISPPHLALPAGGDDIAATLIRLTCSTDRARRAIAAALDGGATIPELATEVSDWLAYCQSPAGSTVRARGFFIAAKIAAREPPPPPRPDHLDSDSPANRSRYISGQFADHIHH